ncbi:MAG: GAF domain-containing protein [Chloroflexi bacterium]|nr:GAF domain-containing protein [Chloroflexota bacterium]MBU1750789.1 GAF domain-containing protein [Chloroflexota bacterium]
MPQKPPAVATGAPPSQQQLELLYNLSQDLSSSLDLNTVARRALDDICTIIGALRGLLLVCDPDCDRLRLAAVFGYDAEPMAELDQRLDPHIYEGLTGWVIAHRQGVLVDDVNTDAHWLAVSGLDDWVRSVLSVPLVSRDDLVGVLNIYSEHPAFFHDDHRRLVELAGATIAAAIANARLYEQAQQRLQSLTNLNRVSQIITSSLDVGQILQQIVDLTGSVARSDYTSVVLLDEDGQPSTRLEDFRGMPPVTRRIRDGGVARHVLDTGQPVVVDEIAPDGATRPALHDAAGQPILANPAVIASDIHSFAAVPIQAKDNMLGVLFVHSRSPHAFGEHLPLLTTFANQAAAALENARLYQAERLSCQQAETLRQAAHMMGASLEPDEILRQILISLKQTLIYDTASVLVLRQNHTPDLVVGIGYADEQLVSREAGNLLQHSPILRRMAQDLQPVVSADVRTLDGWIWVPGAEHVRSWLAVPLVARGQMIGTLMLDSTQDAAYGEAELQIAQGLAQHAAQALENARLYETVRQELAERKQAEAALRVSEAQYKELYRLVRLMCDNVPDLIWAKDLEKRYVFANQAICDKLLFAQDTEEPLGKTDMYFAERERRASPDDPNWHTFGEICADSDTLVMGTMQAQRFDEFGNVRGQFLYLDVYKAPFLDEAGRMMGTVGCARDVTLEREIQQRVQQQERLAAVGQLAAGIAHDFNNILTGIIGFAQLLQRRADVPESAKTSLDCIAKEGQRAAHLIRQILDFSRQSLSSTQYLDLGAFLPDVALFLRHTIPESTRISLQIIAPGPYTVNADPNQIQQVLANLATNAHDAMPDGGNLVVTLERHSLPVGDSRLLPDMSPGDWIVLRVSDTGTGIDPEYRPHLFEPFFTTKEVGKGTGLGLAQVYGIIKQHNGFIDVASQWGHGTALDIYLPAVRQLLPYVPPQAIEPLAGSGETILLVEDEPVVLEALREMLIQLGYQVLTARNGREALSIHEHQASQIHLVLSDLVMPEMDGVALLRALREHAPQVRMLVTTGYALHKQYDQLADLGIRGWLQKPVDQVKLAQALRRTLDDVS